MGMWRLSGPSEKMPFKKRTLVYLEYTDPETLKRHARHAVGKTRQEALIRAVDFLMHKTRLWVIHNGDFGMSSTVFDYIRLCSGKKPIVQVQILDRVWTPLERYWNVIKPKTRKGNRRPISHPVAGKPLFKISISDLG